MKSPSAKNKIYYIDNLRVLMTMFVVLHHTLISFGAPGGWYFIDATTNKPALIIMTLLVATNQAFFMAFFFFLSAYFTEPSYNKKGVSKFITDRLKRLGVPLLFYSFILGPCMNFLVYRYGLHKQATFIQYITGYDDWIDFGVLWFVGALLLFTFVYVLLKQINKNKQSKRFALPTSKQIFLFAIALGMISYVVRIAFPVGWVLHPVGFQLAHFTQYITLFIAGVIAFRNLWMEQLSLNTGKTFIVIALVMVLVIFPLIFILVNSPLDTFQGNGTWQSLTAAVWEQLTGISIIVALSGFAKYKWNYTTSLLKRMSGAAFATYIFHPLIVISITIILMQWNIDPAYKVLVAAPCTITFSFCLGWLITKLPIARNIL